MGIKASVSLYSLQYQYLQGKMDLDAIIKFVTQDLGAQGIEILPDQMLHGTPNPSEETYEQWNALMEKYKPGLACDDIFLNTNLFKNRELTRRECVELIKQEIVMAHRLGFDCIRLVSMVPAWILAPCLETAEKNNVSLNIEIHGGLGFGCQKTDEYIEEMLRLNSPYVGIVPDTSLFLRRKPHIVTEYCDKMFGLNPDLLKYVDEVFAAGKDFFDLSIADNAVMTQFGPMDPKLASLIKEPGDAFYASNLAGYENKPLSIMDGLEKYINHVHLKLYDMSPEGYEYSIDYSEILNYLHKAGYNKYVSTEYEGNRWQLPDTPIPEIEQVTLHQQLVQRLIKEIEG